MNKLTALCVALACLTACGPAHAEDALAIHVTVTGPSGEAVPDFEIAAQYEGDPAIVEGDEALVDQHGHAEMSIPAPAAPARVLVMVSDGWDPDVSSDELVRRTHRYWDDIRPHYHIEPYYAYDVTPGQATLDVAIQFGPAIVVTGRVEDAGGQALWPYISARGVVGFAREVDPAGSFVLSSVPQGQACELFVGHTFAGNDSLVTTLELDAAQTAQNVDLGVLTLVDKVRNASATISLDLAGWHGTEQDGRDQVTVRGVTLLAEDGTFILSYLADQAGQAIRSLVQPQTTLSIPAGTYYLVPGTFSAFRDIHYKAYQLVKSGQAAQVEGWPTLTVEAGQHVDVSFNAAATDALIEAAPEPN